MEHKAYVFDYDRFHTELAPVLWGALETGNIGKLKRFTDKNRDRLTDPWEGQPLAKDWVAPDDVHELGDYALTAYYDPTADVGLGEEWERAQRRVLKRIPGEEDAVVLGYPFGPDDAAFDPGRMGSFFRSAESARQHLGAVLAADAPNKLAAVETMLRRAVDAGQGLYVTF